MEKERDFDVFFYYGEPGSDLELETKSDLFVGLEQPKRSMYYNRRDGVGLRERENYPNAIAIQIGIKFDIINWIGYRNTLVSDSSPDRRIAASQTSISVKTLKDGNIDVNVLYLPYQNFVNPVQANLPIGRGN